MSRTSVSVIALLAFTLSAPAAFAQPATQPQVNPAAANSNQDWWPERLDLSPLRQHARESNPMGDDFDYAK